MLAERLGGRFHPWAGGDHEGHEEALRTLYRQTSLAVSDRLHVLITATTEGAAPVAPLVDDSDKIERHFTAAGIPGVAIRTRGLSTGVIKTALAEAADSWPSVESGLTDSRAQLDAIKARVAALVIDEGPTSDPKAPAAASVPTVWHVGRRGEVAGGMTQVVNAYLSWSFDNVRQRLLVSRNGTTGPSGLRSLRVGVRTTAVPGAPRADHRGRAPVAGGILPARGHAAALGRAARLSDRGPSARQQLRGLRAGAAGIRCQGAEQGRRDRRPERGDRGRGRAPPSGVPRRTPAERGARGSTDAEGGHRRVRRRGHAPQRRRCSGRGVEADRAGIRVEAPHRGAGHRIRPRERAALWSLGSRGPRTRLH